MFDLSKMPLSKEKRLAKLRTVLEKLCSGKTVQNRQLQALLSEESYSRYLDDYTSQSDMRNWLKEKPSVIIEYEKRLKAATFAYSKADAMSARRKSKRIEEKFGNSDTKFERLNEFLSENIEGRPELEAWFDRPIQTDPENSFSLTPDAFPQIVTSRSIRNQGGGYVSNLKSIREVKIDAVQTEIEALETVHDDKETIDVYAQSERLKRLLKYRER
jgi:hypothetical protein